MGALHAVGAWLSVRLAGAAWNVLAIASDGDISTSQLLWYRRQQLSNAGVEVVFLNLSNSSQVKSLVSLRPSHVAYILPVLEHDATPPPSAYWGSYMTGLVSLLKDLTCANFLMVSPSLGTASHDSHMTISQAHGTAFEAVLLTYHTINNSTRYTILRTGPVYGPWTQHALTLLQSKTQRDSEPLETHWYISDLTDAIVSALNKGPFCDQIDICHCSDGDVLFNHSSRQPVERALRRTRSWARAYQQQLQLNKHSTNDVILTSYFTSREDFQRKKSMSPNRLHYMFHWLLSVRDLGLQAVIFHDQLDPAFCQRVMEYYPGVSFRHVPSLLNRTTNDARFYLYLQYLHGTPDVGRVLLTDISDVRFQKNPFDLMQLLGDWLYIGTDIDIYPNMKSQRWISERLEGCFGSHTLHKGPLTHLMSLDTVYNAGVIGGSRHIMLALLEKIVQYLDVTPPTLNCNMPAVNYVIHRYFFQQVFTGFPLTSRFLSYQSSPKGVFIVHK